MKGIQPRIYSDALSEFVSTSRRVLDESSQMNELNTKVKIIQPFLQNVLGWGIYDMELEYSVQMGGQTYHVDYALVVNDLPEVFVEAKGSDTEFNTQAVKKSQSYMKLQDVIWGSLPTGRNTSCTS